MDAFSEKKLMDSVASVGTDGGYLHPVSARWIRWWQWWSNAGIDNSKPAFKELLTERKLAGLTTAPDLVEYPKWLLNYCISHDDQRKLLKLAALLANDPSVNSWALPKWRELIGTADAMKVRQLLGLRGKHPEAIQVIRRYELNGYPIEALLLQEISVLYPALGQRIKYERPDIWGAENLLASPEPHPEVIDFFESLSTHAGFAQFSAEITESDFDQLIQQFERDLLESSEMTFETSTGVE